MARKRRLKPFEAIPFTNDLGNVINPGDSIIAVTMCTRSVSVNTGRYLGLRRHKHTWRSGEEEYFTVVVEYDLVDEYDAHKVTGERWNWRYEPPGLVRPRYPQQQYPVQERLPWSATHEERKASQDRYVAARTESDKKHAAALEEYKKQSKIWEDAVEAYKTANFIAVKHPYTKAKTLQKNRIYPINMQLKDLKKVS